MLLFNQITYKEIDSLTDVELTELLKRLLPLEVKARRIQNDRISAPTKINRADGGEDASISCSNTNGSIYITNTNLIFQNKAKNLTPANCKKELLTPSKKLKPAIKKVLDAGGQYILFMRNHPGSKQDIDNRKNAFFECSKKFNSNYTIDQFDVYDSDKIATWVNCFIEAIIWVQEKNKISRPAGLLSLDKWSQYKYITEFQFFTNKELNDTISSIQNILNSRNVCIRIIGHSGLGKTRLVFEALKGIHQAQESILYYKVETNPDDILNFVKSNNGNLSGILVVDDCTYDLNQKLKSEVTRGDSEFKLVTIDYTVEEEYDLSKKQDQVYYFLNNLMYKDIVFKILESAYASKMDNRQIEYIANYSEGYPSMAVSFVEASINGTMDLTVIKKEIVERLVFGRDYRSDNENSQRYQALLGCSIFSSFSYPFPWIKKVFDDKLYNKAKAQTEFIYSKVCDPAIDENHFHAYCKYFYEKNILEKRGINYSVRPNLLAIKLAAEWWNSKFNKTKIKDLIISFESVGLSFQFEERFKYLDHLEDAKEMAGELAKIDGPFGKAEVLNTEAGSRLFRTLVEVNPKEIVKTLAHYYLNKPKNELLNLRVGRRNLVWTLEKLCFRKDSFDTASKILLDFAVAENEQIGNNSTNGFFQLFQVYLAGTEVNLESRVELIKYALELDEDHKEIAIKAIGKAFQTDHFNRMGGAEYQGGGAPLIDYAPNNVEIIKYWTELVNILIEVLNNDQSKVELVKEQIVIGMRALLILGLEDILELAIKKIIHMSSGLWADAVETLSRSLLYEDGINKDRVNQILDLITPKDLANRIRLVVSVAPYDYAEINGKHTDLAEANAISFADEFKNDLVSLEPYLSTILNGKQRHAFTFGKKLGEITYHDKAFAFKIVEEFKKIEEINQNPDFLAGYIFSSTNNDLKREIIDRILIGNTAKHAFHLTRVWLPNLSDIYKLFNSVESNQVPITQFDAFLFGRSLDSLDVRDVIAFFEKIYSHNDFGKWVALGLLHQYYKTNESKWNDCIATLKNFISNYNYILPSNNIRNISTYPWSDSVEQIVSERKQHVFASSVSQQIQEYFDELKMGGVDSKVKNVCKCLVDNYFDEFFAVLSKKWLQGNFTIKYFLGADYGITSTKGVIFSNEKGNEVILNFIKANPQTAIGFASMIPYYDKIGEEVKWSKLGFNLLSDFIDNKEFMRRFNSHFAHFGYINSPMSKLETRLVLLKQLEDTKNQKIKEWVKMMKLEIEERIVKERLEEEHRG